MTAVLGEPLDRGDERALERADRLLAGEAHRAVDIDRAGPAIAGAAAIFGAGEVRGVAQCPGGDMVPLQDNAPFGSGELDPPLESRKDRGSRLDHSERAAFEAQRSHQRVLAFNPGMQQPLREGRCAGHRSGDPAKQVHGVNRLIDQRAAAIQRQRSAPRGYGIVFRRPVPLDVCAGHDQPTQPPFIHRYL